jgi:argininosuccinate lyase
VNHAVVLIESNTTGSGRDFCTAARRRGCRPVVLCRDRSRYPFLAADRIDTVELCTGDVRPIIAAISGLGTIAGVTSSSEYFVAIAADVAGQLGLPGPDPAAIRNCRDKSAQLRRLEDTGIGVPAHATVRDTAAALSAARRIGYPVIVKPVSGSGSVGVRLCDTPDQLARHLDTYTENVLLVQEYVTGAEFSVEAFDGEVVGITRKHLTPPPYFVETGHDFPATASQSDTMAMSQAAMKAIAALGLRWGPTHTEIRITEAGPRVIEVNPRLAGGLIPRLVQVSTGVDLVACSVAKVTGGSTDLRRRYTRTAAIRFVLADRPGIFGSLTGLDAVRHRPGVVDADVLRPTGHRIHLDHSFQDRVGYVIARDRMTADEAARELGVRMAPPA